LRSGETAARARVNLSEASWTFAEDEPRATSLITSLNPATLKQTSSKAFYQSPLIDRDHNIYVSSMTNLMYSFTPDGQVRWALRLAKESGPTGQLPTPVLVGGSLYTVDGQGSLVALSTESGSEQWRAKYAVYSGLDSWSLGHDPSSGTLYVVGFPTMEDAKRCQWGGTFLYALDARDGSTRWSHQLLSCTCNLMPAIAGDFVVFSDSTGRVYALDRRSGALRWQRPGTPNTFTTGTAATGPNGLLYVTSNLGQGRGIIRSYEILSGEPRWNRSFAVEANDSPAVYTDRSGRLRVVLAVGMNAGYPAVLPVLDVGGSLPGRPFTGRVVALDAETGSEAWAFEPPPWPHQACAGSTMDRMCLPDAWTNPAVDGDSVVYIGWQGGTVFALDGTSGQKLSSYEINSGMQAEPAVADGMLVAVSCKKMVTFRAKPSATSA